MGVNTHCLELIFISLNTFQPQKLMKKDMLAETLFLRRKDKKHQKKNLVVNLLELMQIRVIIKIMKLVEHNHLSINLKQLKQLNKNLKELEDKIKKLTC